MNQNYTPNFKDDFCSSCGYQELRFLHLIWHEDRVQRFCTSCVLRSHKQSFCPTCFAVHDFKLAGIFIRCAKCLSFSHPSCFSSNCSSSRGPLMCSSCINPSIIASSLIKLKVGDKGNLKWMDKNVTDLLLAAAKIATMLISKAVEASRNSAQILDTKASLAKKKATAALNHVVEYVDRENKRNNVGVGNDNDGPSLLDSDGEDDSSSETSEGTISDYEY